MGARKKLSKRWPCVQLTRLRFHTWSAYRGWWDERIQLWHAGPGRHISHYQTETRCTWTSWNQWRVYWCRFTSLVPCSNNSLIPTLGLEKNPPLWVVVLMLVEPLSVPVPGNVLKAFATRAWKSWMPTKWRRPPCRNQLKLKISQESNLRGKKLWKSSLPMCLAVNETALAEPQPSTIRYWHVMTSQWSSTTDVVLWISWGQIASTRSAR